MQGGSGQFGGSCKKTGHPGSAGGDRLWHKKKAAIAAAWSERFQSRGTPEEVVTRRRIFLISNVMMATRRCSDVVARICDGDVNDYIVIKRTVLRRASRGARVF
jgi:hypothetical protein